MDLKDIYRKVVPSPVQSWVRKHRTPVFVSGDPHMPEEQIPVFRRLLEGADCFLEYGAGASTVMAASLVPFVISVESDGRYVRALRRRFNDHAGRVEVIHCKLGPVGHLGIPLFNFRTEGHVRRCNGYASAPWALLSEAAQTPDFILVDGRFRVSCTLTSLMNLPEGAETVFMLDDYDGRQADYKPVIEFVEIDDVVGRSLVFRKSPDFDPERCAAVQAEYACDWH